MSDLFNIGASGVAAYRSALSAVGDNVVNAETPGYARRSVRLGESPVSSGSNPIYRDRMNFGGVDAQSVARAWDDFRAAESRISAADAGRADARTRWLTTAEAALDDSGTGAGAKLTLVFTTADALAGDPGGAMGRNALLAAIDDAALALRNSADGLARTAAGITNEARIDVDAVNGALDGIAKINIAIRRAGAGSGAQASLLDERDRLLDNLSARIGIDVSLDGAGAATVKLAGAADVVLVSPVSVGRIDLAEASDGRLSLSFIEGGIARAIGPTGGTLAGLIDAATTVAGRRTQLDSVAANFAATINNWQATGRTDAGVAGGPLISFTGSAASIALATSDPAAIAAASIDGRANGNLLTLQSLRAAGPESQLAGIIASHAQMVASAKSEASASAARRDGAFASRDEISGIDLDREAADLLRFQQAYDGSARIIQVARETLQSILDIF